MQRRQICLQVFEIFNFSLNKTRVENVKTKNDDVLKSSFLNELNFIEIFDTFKL